MIALSFVVWVIWMLSIKNLVITVLILFMVNFSAFADSDENFVDKVDLQGINTTKLEHSINKQQVTKSLTKEDSNAKSSLLDPTTLLFVLFPLFVLLIRANSKHH